MRWELYLKIKYIVKDRPQDEDSYYITKNEMKSIMNGLDLWKIRQQVFQLYNVPVPNPEIDPPHEILMRAHYTYIIDVDFDKKIRKLKQDHELYITTLLENINYCKELEDIYSEIKLGDKAVEGSNMQTKLHPLDTIQIKHFDIK